MPTRLLLEGDDLRVLMLRVRDELGAGAKIIKAERIRTGGVAGFFARERYELTVEVPDGARRPPRRRPAAPAATGGIDALLQAADAAEVATAEAISGDGPRGPAAAASEAPAASEPVVSTSTGTFADVLESMRQMVGVPADVAAEAEVRDVDAFAPASPPRGSDEAVASRAAAQPAWAAGPTVVQSDGRGVGQAPTVPVGAGPGGRDGADAAAGRPRGNGSGPSGSGANVAALLELGVPARLLQGFSDLATPVPLSVVVRRIPVPPEPQFQRGSVIGIVGESRDVLRTATQLALKAGIDPLEIALAGDIEPVAGHGRRLLTPSAVERHRARADRNTVTIVAIGVPPGGENGRDTAALLSALHPHQAWGAIDARLRFTELRRWIASFSGVGPFDVLAAWSVFEAQSPGTILGLDAPIGLVDGLPASPVVWAAVLGERLTDDARWD